LQAYLASESEEDDDDEQNNHGAEETEAIRERYRRLLLAGGKADDNPAERKGNKDWDAADGTASDEDDADEGARKNRKTSRQRDRDMEMEVTFVPGLEGLGERLLAKKKDAAARKAESVWDAYLRRKKEKKEAAKRLGRAAPGSDSDDSGDGGVSGSEDSDRERDLPAGVADDPFFQREEEEDPFADPFFNVRGPVVAIRLAFIPSLFPFFSFLCTVLLEVRGTLKIRGALKE
jgi:hypothetical protein